LPSRVFSDYRAQPALLLLAGEPVDATAEDLQRAIDWTRAGVILVHRNMLQPDQRERIEALIAQVATLEQEEADLALYRVPFPGPRP
jgi:hypothetical protein